MGVGFVLISLAAVSWGTTGATMAMLAHRAELGPLVVGWARVAVAAPCLVGAACWRQAGSPAPSAWTARDRFLVVALGSAMAAYQICYFWAVTLTGVAVTALLAICSAPLFIAAASMIVFGDRLSRPVILSLAMAVAGVALLVMGRGHLDALGDRTGRGAVLAVAAGVSYAVYAVAAKRLLARQRPLPVAAATFSLAALLLLPVLAIEGVPPGALGAGWPFLIYLGVGPTAAAYVLFNAGLARVPASRAGIVTLLEPLTASLLGVLCFGERLGALGLAGAALLLLALALLARSR